MSRFVSEIRTRPQTVHLVTPDGLTPWTVRVQCAEAWDAIRMDVAPNSLVRDVKQAAMAVLMSDVSDRDEFVVKLRGCEVRNEMQSLEGAGAHDGSTLLVMSRRRRPVR